MSLFFPWFAIDSSKLSDYGICEGTNKMFMAVKVGGNRATSEDASRLDLAGPSSERLCADTSPENPFWCRLSRTLSKHFSHSDTEHIISFMKEVSNFIYQGLFFISVSLSLQEFRKYVYDMNLDSVEFMAKESLRILDNMHPNSQ